MFDKIKKILPMELNFELKNFIQYFKKSKTKIKTADDSINIFYLDAPSYNNLGDQAIAYAMSLFIKDKFNYCNYIEITENDLLRNLKNIKKIIKDKDIICLSGGGNMGNLYPRYEAIRRKVIRSFKNNQIIIFPQTIDYENNKYGQKEMKKSAKVYNKHQNLTVCAREKKSYETMKKLYKDVIMVPDIVLYLYDRIKIKQDYEKKVVGICLRDDKESTLSEEKKDNLIKKIKETSKIKKLTTMSDQEIITNENREEVLYKKFYEFSKCKLIITDRLHGMIFSIICHIPCLYIDNSNKKISGVYEVVKDNYKEVQMFKENNYSKIIEELKKNDKCLIKNDNELRNKYKDLENVFQI